MENAEEIYHFLEDFSKRKPKTIPQELNDYLAYVARTGDPVYQWSLVKSLFKEKLLNVITEFYETTPGIEIPPYPNVDPFNYDIMKNALLERLDSFTSAPFTVQRICELLTFPRKQYNRIDKFMRAIEKNILVVSTREPGIQRHPEPENGEAGEPIVNGSDNNSEYNVDVEMEDMSWKEASEHQQPQNAEPQPSSSDTHISVDDLEARLQAKQETAMEAKEKTDTQYESVTPPELNVTDELDVKPTDSASLIVNESDPLSQDDHKTETMVEPSEATSEPKVDVEMKTEEPPKDPLIIPEIKVDDAEMTEQRLNEQSKVVESPQESRESEVTAEKEMSSAVENKVTEDIQQANIDDSSSDSVTKEETEPKVIISEVSTSSEESSSSSENTDCNSDSPKVDSDAHIYVQEESSSDTNQSEPNIELNTAEEKPAEISQEVCEQAKGDSIPETCKIQSENYTILDVKSELQQTSVETPAEALETESEVKPTVEEVVKKEEEKSEPTGLSAESNSIEN